jgi:uncharacterized membrane protein
VNLFILIILFIISQLLLGRKVSIPYGIAVGLNVYLVLSLATTIDICLIPFVFWVYKGTTRKISLVIKKRLSSKEEKINESRMMRFIKPLGRMGVLVVTAIPFSGGVLTGIALCRLLKLRYKESFVLLSIGSFLGCLLFVLGVEGIIKLIFK